MIFDQRESKWKGQKEESRTWKICSTCENMTGYLCFHSTILVSISFMASGRGASSGCLVGVDTGGSDESEKLDNRCRWTEVEEKARRRASESAARREDDGDFVLTVRSWVRFWGWLVGVS